MDQAAFLEIMRRMAEQDAQQGTHPPAQNNPLTFMQGLDQVQQQSLRGAAYWAARARGDEDTQQSIMGGGRYEPGMITGSELGDFPAQILLDSTNIIPGMGLPTPAELMALAAVIPRAGTAVARTVARAAGMSADDLFKGLTRAGVHPNFARLPGVQSQYDDALRRAAEGQNILSLTDDVSAVRGGRGYIKPNQKTVDDTRRLFDSFSANLGAPSTFELQTAVDAQIAARRRMLARELVAAGATPADAQKLAAAAPASQLPTSPWYESMTQGLQGAVSAGARPEAARAMFNTFNIVSGGYSPMTTVKSQVTKALRSWGRMTRGASPAQAITLGPPSATEPIQTFLTTGRAFQGQKTGSFVQNLSGNLGPDTFDTMMLRSAFHNMIESYAGGASRDPRVLSEMAEHFGLMGREVVVGTGKNRQVILVTADTINDGRITMNALSDELYSNIANSGRYSMFIEPRSAAARSLGYPPARGQATGWIGFGDITNVDSLDDIYTLTTNGIRRMSGHTRLSEPELYKRLLEGRLRLHEAAGVPAAIAFMAEGWFLAHQAQADGLATYEEIVAAMDDEGADDLTAEDLNRLAGSGGLSGGR